MSASLDFMVCSASLVVVGPPSAAFQPIEHAVKPVHETDHSEEAERMTKVRNNEVKSSNAERSYFTLIFKYI